MSLVPERISAEWIIWSGVDCIAEYISPVFKDGFMLHPTMHQ